MRTSRLFALLIACFLIPAPVRSQDQDLTPFVREPYAKRIERYMKVLRNRTAVDPATASSRDVLARSAASGDGTWSSMFSQVPYGHMAIYDPLRDRMVVIGATTTALSSTGAPVWTALVPAGSTPAGKTSFYDPVRDRVILYGDDSNVWSLSLAGPSSWTQLASTGTHPPDSWGPVAIYDPVRDRMLVFALPEGVWELPLSGDPVWTELATTGTSPPSPFGFSVMYDPLRDRAIVFGGDEDYDGRTWSLSLSGNPVWTEIATTGTTQYGLLGHSAIYDPLNDRMVVFGGRIWGAYANFTLWALDLSGSPEWTELVPAGRLPQTRAWHAATFDPTRARMLIYGGDNQTSRTDDIWTDTWALALTGDLVWTAIEARPSPRNGHSAIYDPVRDRMLVFGGRADRHRNDPQDDLPVLSLSGTPKWSVLNAGPSPDISGGHAAVYDPSGDRMVVVGGSPPQAWELDLSGTPAWAHMSPSGTPPSEPGPAIYDPVRDRMLVINGTDVFALSLSGSPAWSGMSASGTPAGLGGPVVYDPVRDRMLVVGLQDLWALSLAGSPAWATLSTSGMPTFERIGYSAIYDPVRDRVVIFGGRRSTGGYNESWAVSLSGSSVWTLMTPDGSSPLPRYRHTAIYDPRRDRMIIFGGIFGFYDEDRDDTWSLEWGSPLDATPPRITVTLNRDMLWPPNHKFVSVCATVDVTDDVDSAPTYTLVSITGVDGGHAIDVSQDVRNAAFGTADLCFDLRATRSGTGDGRVYQIVYQASDLSSNMAYDTVRVTVPHDMGHQPDETKRETALTSIYPNPFNPQTTVEYSLEAAGRVFIAVYDVRGSLIRRLVDESRPAGDYQFVWSGDDATGRPMSSGIYFMRMTAGSYSETRKVVLLK